MCIINRQASDKGLLFLFPLITFGLFVAAAVLYWVILLNPWHLW